MNYNEITYKMSKETAKIYLKSRKGNEAKINPNAFLCSIVNAEYGVKGTCVEVVLY